MKKTIIALGAALLTLAACNKVETAPAVQDLKLDLTVSCGTPGTKALKTGWENGDVVYVFFGKASDYEEVAYLTLTYKNGEWEEAWTDGLKEKIAATTSGQLAALYSPHDLGQIVRTYIGDEECFGFSDMTATLHMACDHITYQVSNGTLSATLPLNADEKYVQFYIPGLTWSQKCVLDVEYGVVEGRSVLFKDGSIVLSTAATSPKAFPMEGGAAFWGIIEDDAQVEIIMLKIDDTSYNLWLDEEKTLHKGDAIVLPTLDSGKWKVVKN